MTTAAFSESALQVEDKIGLRCIFSERSYTLASMQRRLSGIASIVALSQFEMDAATLDPDRLPIESILTYLRDSTTEATRRAMNLRVERAGLQSPYEVLLAIAASTSSALVLANRVIALRERWDHSRVVRAESSFLVAKQHIETVRILSEADILGPRIANILSETEESLATSFLLPFWEVDRLIREADEMIAGLSVLEVVSLENKGDTSSTIEE